MCRHPASGVIVVFAAESHEQVGDGLAEQVVFFLAARLEGSELLAARPLEFICLRTEASLCFSM